MEPEDPDVFSTDCLSHVLLSEHSDGFSLFVLGFPTAALRELWKSRQDLEDQGNFQIKQLVCGAEPQDSYDCEL